MNYDIPEYLKSDFYAKWLKTFAPQLTSDQYNEYIRNAFIWHIFSFELVPRYKFLEGDAARAAFDKVCKSGAVFMRLWSGDAPRTLDSGLTAADIEKDCKTSAEFYAVGADFSWTYVVTHENCCGLGPYFMFARASEKSV